MAHPYQDLIDELAWVGRDAVARGLVVASGGNLSVRCGDRDAFVVTAAGTWLDRLATNEFSTISGDGSVIDGNRVPSSEWKLHWRTYRARPDVNAVVHLHPQAAVVLDALGHEVRLLTLDHAAYLGRIRRIPFLPNGSDELAEASAQASLDSNVVILAHHGCSTLGDSVSMAYRRALNLAEAAENTFRCLQLGDRTTRFPADAAPVLHGTGSTARPGLTTN
jgi:ribulose-5-phosphate 4-epimerase/fuculose-1-phosphate aldolase